MQQHIMLVLLEISCRPPPPIYHGSQCNFGEHGNAPNLFFSIRLLEVEEKQRLLQLTLFLVHVVTSLSSSSTACCRQLVLVGPIIL